MTARCRSVAVLLGGVLVSACADTGMPEKPNIVFIMADDLGYGHLGAYGQTQIRTPSIDRMAAEGVRFTQFYSGSTVCAPARSVLMTGRHTGHTSVRGNTGGIPLLPEDVTVGEVLQQAGYVTGVFGKWGLGDHGTAGVPYQQGFDEFFGYLHQVHAHFYYTPFLWENDRQVQLPGNEDGGRETYTHDEITDRALDFVRRHREQPFFLYLAYTIPHTELLVPEDAMEEYEGAFPEPAPYPGGHYAAQERPRTAFAAMVSRMDKDVGRLFDLLAELGLDEETIVFFTSDNGGQEGWGVDLDFFAGNAPLRGSKMNLYEGGIRVPLVVWWPGVIEAARVSDHVWAFWDVLPTLAELAGATASQGIDGLSMVPALVGETRAGRAPPEHAFLYWEYGNVLGQAPVRQAVRWGTWKGIRDDLDQPLELYDLEADVGETTDLALGYPEVASRLRAYLDTARAPTREYPAEVSSYSYVGQEIPGW
jgi:arylsulfatase A-like enzyme